ncbi:MAG: CCA tRNA nucleotidyltransferase [Ahrensia sp.]
MADKKLTADWLADVAVQQVFDLLGNDGEEVWAVGGAVRNTLLSVGVKDIDFATTCTPDVMLARARAAEVKAVPTGIDHGTITLVIGKKTFEVTTLRSDVATDGRHAQVVFTRNMAEDASRRDFTINALYVDRDGTLLDPCDGLRDIDPVVIRFIGDAEARIQEDYLRSLRFYRFFAWFGQFRPDAAGIKATAKLKAGLDQLSAERIWQEMSRLLAAPDPSRALLWMRQAGVLTAVLPESENWGIDEIHGLIAAEQALGWLPDAVLRLMAVVPSNEERMAALAKRWKLSNSVRDRLLAWATQPDIAPTIDDGAFARLLYRHNQQAIIDTLRLDVAKRRARQSSDFTAMGELARMTMLLEKAVDWKRPVLPVSGQDFAVRGYEQGKALGEALKALEDEWVASGFSLTRDALLSKIAKP